MRNTADDIEQAAHRFEQLADEFDSATAERLHFADRLDLSY